MLKLGRGSTDGCGSDGSAAESVDVVGGERGMLGQRDGGSVRGVVVLGVGRREVRLMLMLVREVAAVMERRLLVAGGGVGRMLVVLRAVVRSGMMRGVRRVRGEIEVRLRRREVTALVRVARRLEHQAVPRRNMVSSDRTSAPLDDLSVSSVKVPAVVSPKLLPFVLDVELLVDRIRRPPRSSFVFLHHPLLLSRPSPPLARTTMKVGRSFWPSSIAQELTGRRSTGRCRSLMVVRRWTGERGRVAGSG
jgi:hypothetical protein